MRNFTILILFAVTVLLSCSENPLDRPYNEETITQDLEEILEYNQDTLTTSAIFLSQVEMMGGIPAAEGETYRQVADKNMETARKML